MALLDRLSVVWDRDLTCANFRHGFAFRSMADIAHALGVIEADYATHSQAARELAREYFAADRVLGSLLERAGL